MPEMRERTRGCQSGKYVRVGFKVNIGFMSNIKEFPLSVIEKLEYYVYLLIDPETNHVFYVGKGTGNRIFAHINAAIVDAGAGEKLDKIRDLRARGIEVRHVIHRLY